MEMSFKVVLRAFPLVVVRCEHRALAPVALHADPHGAQARYLVHDS